MASARTPRCSAFAARSPRYHRVQQPLGSSNSWKISCVISKHYIVWGPDVAKIIGFPLLVGVFGESCRDGGIPVGKTGIPHTRFAHRIQDLCPGPGPTRSKAQAHWCQPPHICNRARLQWPCISGTPRFRYWEKGLVLQPCSLGIDSMANCH